ncbi:3-isopropylmalate dehydratase large subunit [Paracoccus sediminicola]|uniref:3-isopropylmalate dehydratase large subunit n=1 Tax=Paracoccus sediminicola TaxID=3017783 RepID=UPI0022EFF582|nr:3-isopropylmalate dehydratase large subunit [Paracoccus sediminicola]WBU56301.1 3-isopropylmalate dehydratase large subunit [Paracoccus sediminicola]
MAQPSTLFDKVWDAHEILRGDDGRSLLWVDRHFVHEGSFHAFTALAERGRKVVRPDLTFGVADHYVPTIRTDLRRNSEPRILDMVRQLRDNASSQGIHLFGLDDPRQGIVHVVGPEQGLTLPGLLMVCGDSHTSTHGAFGSIAFGIGASDVAHVLATQTLWQMRPKRMRLTIEGSLGSGVSAKDVALTWIRKLGADGARGHVIEYAGEAIRAMSMEARLTLCNLSIEGGARYGMVAPDDTTIAYLRDRPWGPQGSDLDAAAEDWLELRTDEGATFDRDVVISADEIAPTVTWGVSPEEALPIDETVPDPAAATERDKAQQISDSLDYMGLTPGQKLTDVWIDRVFIGSCTNARIEDLRAAAAILKGRRSRVPGLVSPGSSLVKRQAEEEGLDRIFIEAGLEWRESGCSMCVGMNGDRVPSGERCASTTNRNFRGRQGPGSRTHLMSPSMVAAAAVTGHLSDVRTL